MLEAEVAGGRQTSDERDRPVRSIRSAPHGSVEESAPSDPSQVAEIYASLGRLRFSEGDYLAAIEAYRRAAELRPDIASMQSNLGAALLAASRHEDAVTPLARAVALDPSLGIAELNLGLALYRLDRLPEAASHLDRAAVLEPGNAGVFLVRGMLRESAGWRDAAIADYRRVLEIDSRHDEAGERLRALSAPP